MPWRRCEFRGQEVFVRVLPTGKPIVRRGLVEVRYKLGASKSYRTLRENVELLGEELLEDSAMGGSAPATTGALRETPSSEQTSETIVIHTDGACSGNPGPAGIGVLIERRDEEVEISEYLGSGTNNIAELTAILRALEGLREDERERTIHLYTDSGWSLGVLVGGWKAKTNLELIARIRELMPTFPRLELLKVRGHAGHAENERADELATMAVRREASLVRTRPRRDGRVSDPEPG
jgi:ribonuclease HI